MSNTCMMHFFLALFYLENLYSLYLHITLFVSLCIYHYHHKQVHYFIFIKLLNLSHISVLLFNTLLSLVLKDIVLLLSKHLSCPIIWGSFIHNGLMTPSWLYPMKYLSKLFVPYGSFLEDYIALTSMSSILVFFI